MGAERLCQARTSASRIRPLAPRAVRSTLSSLASRFAAGVARYPEVTAPVHLIYGDKDWSRPSDRQANKQLLPRAEFTQVPSASHFIAR